MCNLSLTDSTNVLYNVSGSSGLFNFALMGLIPFRIYSFSSGFHKFGTSPELSTLFISSKKLSYTIYESVNRKHSGT
jgi:hypothetical protein